MDVTLDHCVIAVADRERSDSFYRDVVGADVIGQARGRVAYRFGIQQLNVHDSATDAGTLVARIPVRPGNSDLCFTWPGPIEDAVAHLRTHGVTIEAGPVARDGARGSGRSVYFRDPDGTLLEFISYA